MRGRFGLTHLFVFVLMLVAVAYTAGFSWVLSSSQRSILAASASLRDAASRRVGDFVTEHLDHNEAPIDDLFAMLKAGTCDAKTPEAITPCLYSEMIRGDTLSEVAYTAGQTDNSPAWEVSVFREVANEDSALCIRTTRQEHDGSFRAVSECHDLEEPWTNEPREKSVIEHAMDPTDTFAFTTPARNVGSVLHTDLAWSALDRNLPEEKRRVVLSQLFAVPMESAKAAQGVIRASVLADELDDRILHTRVNEADPNDPHRVFITDADGRLITKLSPTDRLAEMGDDLRVVPKTMPPEVAAALKLSAVHEVSADPKNQERTELFELAGRRYFATVFFIPESQDWRSVIVGPEDYYLGEVRAARKKWVAAFAASLFLLALIFALSLRSLRSGLRRIEASATQLRSFDFAPKPSESGFKDVQTVLEGLEYAKTSLRALAKYVPVPLVRKLFEANQEPKLGGEEREISVLFTDIKDFTTLSESMKPDELARMLGRYLEVMTHEVHATAGIVDKYVGDALMALWNAASPVEKHAVNACRAALRCVSATKKLFESEEWRGRPLLLTRFGIHTDVAMVGHFGAPDRMSFTAIGDGVNLASRLEGLNKAYGTTIIVSAETYARARDFFEFRLLDRVAVKGKSRAIEVYELLSEKSEAKPRNALLYEHALAAYFDRRFSEAKNVLAEASDDLAARVLKSRCEAFEKAPPPADWNGVFHATEK